MSKCLEEYEACLIDLLGVSKGDFYITRPKGHIGLSIEGLNAIDLHFVDYRATSSIESIIGMFSLEVIKEEASERKFNSILIHQMDDAVAALAEYAARLPESEDVGGAGIEAIRQLRDLRDAANVLAPIIEGSIRLLKDEQKDFETKKVRAATDLRKTPAERPPVLISEEELEREAVRISDISATEGAWDRLVSQAATFSYALNHAARARERLGALASVVGDQRIRDEFWQEYLRPLAMHFEERAGRPLVSIWDHQSLFWSIAGSVLAFLVLAGVFWPYLGQPSFAGMSAAAAVAIVAGILAGTGRLSGHKIGEERRKVRTYFENALRVGEVRIAGASDQIFAVLDRTVSIPPQADEKGRARNGQLSEAGWKRVTRNDTEFPPLRFASPGAQLPKLLATISSLVAGVTVALAGSLVLTAWPTIGAFSRVWFDPDAPIAHVVREADLRETCEIGSARIAWQTEGHVFLTNVVNPFSLTGGEADVTSIAVENVSAIRYGALPAGVTPCETQASGSSIQVHAPIELSAPISVTMPVGPAVPGSGNIEVSVPAPVIIANIPQTVTQMDPVTKTVETTLVDFNSYLYVAGKRVEPPDAEYKYIVLPFYGSVQNIGGETREAYFNNIYRYYDGREGKGALTTMLGYLGPVKETLAAKLMKGCEVDIDVVGYASDDTFPRETDASNYVLAEGRRAKVIEALFAPTETLTQEMLDHLHVHNGGPPGKVGQAILPLTDPPVTLAQPTRFKDHTEMSDNLADWLTQDDQDATEALARSVVLVIRAEDLVTCRKSAETTATLQQ